MTSDALAYFFDLVSTGVLFFAAGGHRSYATVCDCTYIGLRKGYGSKVEITKSLQADYNKVNKASIWY